MSCRPAAYCLAVVSAGAEAEVSAGAAEELSAVQEVLSVVCTSPWAPVLSAPTVASPETDVVSVITALVSAGIAAVVVSVCTDAVSVAVTVASPRSGAAPVSSS